jgi:hypothetical protein
MIRDKFDWYSRVPGPAVFSAISATHPLFDKMISGVLYPSTGSGVASGKDISLFIPVFFLDTLELNTAYALPDDLCPN